MHSHSTFPRATLAALILISAPLPRTLSQPATPDMPEMWSSTITATATTPADPLATPDTRWFQDAKFGLFIHWGLYSHLANEWRGKTYYGSGEWLMNRAKIPAAEYAAIAKQFNPAAFDAPEWARFAREAGARYLVITAKHHEGFAMFASKASPFNIVDATPYARDPMAALSKACAAENIKFGFYYSQYLDWHEPNGGGNTWDFDKNKKDTKKYYAEKSIPQIKELLANYGPLGLVWFDMPGGLTRGETAAFLRQVRALQPQCLVSSRVGQGLGDFRDFGDSELPPAPIAPPWEALFTHNDSWGYIRHDQNFKPPREIIRLLASTAARGGNLLLNVGPDGAGQIPEKSLEYLREVGRWLAKNGDAIYNTTASPIPDQPWGVMTSKPGKLFLHVFEKPRDGVIIVPGMGDAKVVAVMPLHNDGKAKTVNPGLRFTQQDGTLRITLPRGLPLLDEDDTVFRVIFAPGSPPIAYQWAKLPTLISRQYDNAFLLDASLAKTTGNATLKSITNSRYFGNWKHDPCITGMTTPSDKATFPLRILDPGDYRITLEYYCSPESKSREGIIRIGDYEMPFETLLTGAYDRHQPLPLVRHAIGIFTAKTPADLTLDISPKTPAPDTRDLLWLRRVIIDPVR